MKGIGPENIIQGFITIKIQYNLIFKLLFNSFSSDSYCVLHKVIMLLS